MINKKTEEVYKDSKGRKITLHGFRSTFRDWAADMTTYPREVVETGMAHVVSDKTEAAYRRTDFIKKRANLMQEWNDFCFRNIK